MAPALTLTLSPGHTADAQRYPGALRLRRAGKGTHTAAGWRRRSGPVVSSPSRHVRHATNLALPPLPHAHHPYTASPPLVLPPALHPPAVTAHRRIWIEAGLILPIVAAFSSILRAQHRPQ